MILRTAVALSLLAMFSSQPVQPQDRSQGRSLVITREGIVATSHTLASQAGAQVLAKGGSAVDAAIAANAVLAVTEPMMCGMGGDLFVLYWEAKTGKLHGLNASGSAPRRLTPAFLQDHGLAAMPAKGIHSVSVPGAVDGWSKMHGRFGRLPWKDLFRAAIHYAEQGFPAPEMIQAMWDDAVFATANEEARRVFQPGGRVPGLGEVFRNPNLGRALRLLSERGPREFYTGEIARAILATSSKLEGVMEAADLAEFSAEWVEPISTTYRGWRVFELPPNGQGMAALQILNILEQFQPAPGGPASVEELHKRIEATRIAYADLAAYNADPRHAKVPVAGLLSKAYARERAKLIDPARANCDVPAGKPPSGDTVYLAVVDKEGNIASWIQSIAARWGSGVAVDGMGFMLHNRAGNFVLDAAHPNRLDGRKRPFHTIIPAFMERGGTRVGFGIMGGYNQPLAHAQFVSNYVDYGMNLQAALEAPRFTKLLLSSCEISIESRIPSAAIDGLRAMEHAIKVFGDYSIYMGRGQAVLRDGNGVNWGASDPRGDGSAEPEPLP